MRKGWQGDEGKMVCFGEMRGSEAFEALKPLHDALIRFHDTASVSFANETYHQTGGTDHQKR